MLTLSSKDGFVASVEKALDDIDPNWRSYKGLLMTGTHAPTEIDFNWALEQIKQARESGTPTLGICFGLHLAVIEFARHVLNLPEANTTELDKDTITPIVNSLPGVRVGIRPVLSAMENHWHQYKVNNAYFKSLIPHFHIIATREMDGEEIIEQMTLLGHPSFILTQYHPEYNSRPGMPHPILVNFINACKRAT